MIISPFAFERIKKGSTLFDHVIKPCLGARELRAAPHRAHQHGDHVFVTCDHLVVTCDHVFVTCDHVFVTCVCDM